MLRTERLVLRRWKDSDREPFAALNAAPRVMEFFPSTLTREECDAMIDRIERHFEERGFGLWSVEVQGGPSCIGFVGLWTPTFEAHFTPCVEIGWRLAYESWGNGYAPEAARAALRFGFENLGLDEIVAMAVAGNHRSRRVMDKLGMTYDPNDDFDHPRFESGHPLQRHVLYRLPRSRWTP